MGTGTKLKTLREQKRLSQEELAFAVGVTQTTISNWEKGKSIRHEYLLVLARALDVKVEDLLNDRKEPIAQKFLNDTSQDFGGFDITVKPRGNYFEDLSRKMDFIISKFSR